MNKSHSIVVCGLMIISAVAHGGRSASACGGLFCDLRLPVNQVAEQIIFHQAKDEVTAVVRIQYIGPAREFAWVVPVPGIPRLSVANDQLFQALETITRPRFELDRVESRCPPQEDPSSGGCGNCSPGGGGFGGGSGGSFADDPVEILSQETVGPFDTQVVTSQDPEALARWLEQNDYGISERGAQLITPYVDEGMNFVTLKLTKNAQVGEIQPLVMQYRSNAARPMIPLRLTAVAAEADMGIAVWIVAGTRAITLNYPHVEVDYAQLNWYQGNDSAYASYQRLVTRAMNEAGGQGFVTDYAGEFGDLVNQLPMTQNEDEVGRELFSGNPYVTRLYTTLSPNEMTLDPVFSYNEDLGDQPLLREATLHVFCVGTEHWLLRLGAGTGRAFEEVGTGIGIRPRLPLDPARPALHRLAWVPIRLVTADENLEPLRLPFRDGDGDGADDGEDGCPGDPDKVTPGVCGCAVPDIDTDEDGTPDCLDLCPDDPDKTVPGLCGCGVVDADADGDLMPDCLDGCPDDAHKTHPGLCGCAARDADADGDGVICDDNCPVSYNPTQADGDGDGIGDACDLVTAGVTQSEPQAAACGAGMMPLILLWACWLSWGRRRGCGARRAKGSLS